MANEITREPRPLVPEQNLTKSAFLSFTLVSGSMHNGNDNRQAELQTHFYRNEHV